MVKVTLPDFYMAIVLDDTTTSSTTTTIQQSHVHELNQSTCNFLIQRLQSYYIKEGYSTVSNIEFQFSNIEILGTKKKPEELSRFHIYWEVKQAIVYFDTTIENVKTPQKEELFDKIGEQFDSQYCLQVLRCQQQQGSNSSKSKSSKVSLSPITKLAIEIEVRRLSIATDGGAVILPPFYMGFVCEEIPTRRLTNEECSKLIQHVKHQSIPYLQKAYNNKNKNNKNEFQSLELQITKTEIGNDALQPDNRFQLYIQYEATAIFQQNAPKEPMDIFRILTQLMSREFLNGTRDCGGPVLGMVIQMAIRVCVWAELPDLKPVKKIGGDAIYQPISFHLEFFVALVVRNITSLPNQQELIILDNSIHSFLTSYLQSIYGAERFLKIQLQSDASYNVGRPLPRFNTLHQYEVAIQFQDHMAPDPTQVLTKIVNCNVGALLIHITSNGGCNTNNSSSSSSIWKDAAEVTLGRGLQPNLPSDHAYGGKIAPLQQQQQRDNLKNEEMNDKSKSNNKSNTPTPTTKKSKSPMTTTPTATTTSSRPSTTPPSSLSSPSFKPATTSHPKKQPTSLSPSSSSTDKSKSISPPRPSWVKPQQAQSSSSSSPPIKPSYNNSNNASPPPSSKTKSNTPAAALPPAAKKSTNSSWNKPITGGTTTTTSPSTTTNANTTSKPPRTSVTTTPRPSVTPPPPRSSKTTSGDVKPKRHSSLPSKKQASQPRTSSKGTDSTTTTTNTEINPSSLNASNTSSDNVIRVKTSDVYLSLTVANCDVSPTKSDYDALVQTANEFYMKHLTSVFGTPETGQFQSVTVSVHSDAFNQGKPVEKYNVYVEWDIEATFQNGTTAPDRHKLCESLIHLDVMVLLKDHVRSLDGTPFMDAIGIYTQQVNS